MNSPLVQSPELAAAMALASGGDSDKEGDKKRQVDMLLEVAPGPQEIFHTPDGDAYADIVGADGAARETWKVTSKAFKSCLRRRFHKTHGTVPAREALNQAIDMVEAMAMEADEREVFTRVGSHDGAIYIDMADKKWRAIKITANGWCIDANPPVRFRRSKGMLPLPEPKHGGNVTQLRKLINFREGPEGEADFVLLVHCLLAALRHHSTYPIVCLIGEQGSAKSTLSRIFRMLVDPNAAPLRALPRDNWDAFIGGTNGYVLVFDNVSGIPDWLSDTMCRLSTGGGFSVRELYSNDSETLFNVSRPQILNGITDVVSRPDLADRAVFLTLLAIPEDRRRTESEILAEFEREAPSILGTLLTAVARGLKELPSTKLSHLPRMADFALWASACESALPWPMGTFAAAYDANRRGAVAAVIDASPVASAVLSFMDERTSWQGIAKDLLPFLTKFAGEQVANSKDWPKTPRGLRTPLQRAAAPLRQLGITITFDDRNHKAGRLIRIELAARKDAATSSTPSTQSTEAKNRHVVVDDFSLAPQEPSTKPSTANDLKIGEKSQGVDDVDDVDGPAGAYRLADQICVQCQGPVDGKEQRYTIGGKSVWLHPECHDYLTKPKLVADPWDAVGPMPSFLDRSRNADNLLCSSRCRHWHYRRCKRAGAA